MAEKYFIQRWSNIVGSWQDATFHGQAGKLNGFDSMKELLIAVHDGDFQAGVNVMGVEYRIIRKREVTHWEVEVILE